MEVDGPAQRGLKNSCWQIRPIEVETLLGNIHVSAAQDVHHTRSLSSSSYDPSVSEFVGYCLFSPPGKEQI